MGKGRQGMPGAAVDGVVSKEIGGGVRVCPWYDEKTMKFFGGDSVPNVFALFQRGAKLNADGQCLGYRKPLADGTVGDFVWLSYSEVLKKCVRFGTALLDLGLEKGSRIGIYSRNNPSWMIASYGAASQGIVTIPIYDTLGPEAAEYVINHAGVEAIVVEQQNLDRLLAIRDKCPNLKHIILTGMAAPEDPKLEKTPAVMEDKVPGLLTFGAFLAKGTDDVSKIGSVDLDDLFVIMYTSGTTGDPKGVMLKHRSFVDSVGSAYLFFEKLGVVVSKSDVQLSYLPLAHIFAQQADCFMYGCGGSVGFSQGNIKLILEDLMACKPTIFVGVPRVFARFEQRIQDAVKEGSFIKRFLFGFAKDRQMHNVEALSPSSGLWDGLVFSKVRARLLPRVRMVVSGSAPLNPKTNNFLKVIFNCPVMQGFGLTETVGGLICSYPLSMSGTCGGPLPGVQVKLVDVPEMNYKTSNSPPQGELWLKSSVLSHGYYKNEQATSEAFFEGGWFATGDIAQFNDAGSPMADGGSISIIDRKKNLFKLSQGEYVSPERLEAEYAKATLVAQIWVYGNSLEDSLIAVVVPDTIEAKKWAEHHGHVKEKNDIKALAAMPDFKAEVLKQLEEKQVESKFKRYEVIKDCLFETDVNDLNQGFNVENDLMTPTFKLKRPQLSAKYKVALEGLYEKMKK
ncbi:Fatty acyl-CoA synthetase A [Porphyridium purpureum]|uniref:Fatty acyl-CoA synthetase A n=1 Tax=Porphyridium purpureum TaxID=35688 RepID=A0A5J4YPW6_PORPP|nr:Fatty acyl-CoA synthetase A [Porphyridium purpureum]|eukprot:POR4073..scf236_6